MAVLTTAGRAAATPIAEPVMGEAVTDVDSATSGEIEVDSSATLLRRRSDGALFWRSETELEYRLTRWAGLGLGLEFSGGDARSQRQTELFEVAPSLGLSIWHDWKREIHVQLEASARLGEQSIDQTRLADQGFEAGESFLPYAVRLRVAWRHDRLVLRPSAGMSFGGDSPRKLPVLAEMAVLVTWGREQLNSLGIENSIDLGRLAPYMVGPGISVGIRAIGPLIPVMKVGLALPITFGTDGRQPIAGVFLHLTAESD